jgi:DNA-binding GntR family transcriptional regulator
MPRTAAQTLPAEKKKRSRASGAVMAERAQQVAADKKRAGAPQTLTEKAYADLEELIVTLKIAPGTAVSEASLSTQLGIGRTPIREALQRLARERLVVILPQRGIFVSEINVKSQLKLLELRRELERLIARSAARRANDEERQRFQEISDGLEQAARTNDEVTFMRLDREFNMLSLEAARNEFLSSSMALTHALSRRFWYIHYKKVGDMPLAAKLHATAARAIAKGNEAAAAKASDALLDYLEEFARATIDVDY